jgi:hypothetical protein
VFIVDASIRERDARFPATISDLRDAFLLFVLPTFLEHPHCRIGSRDFRAFFEEPYCQLASVGQKNARKFVVTRRGLAVE